MFVYGESLETRTMKFMNECEKLVDQMFKASGLSVMDVLSFDAETGAMISSIMNIYKSSEELAVTQAKATDKLIENMEELKELNENLRKQNSDMRQLLQDLNQKVEKIGSKEN